MSLLDTLPHECKIQRRTNTNDALGGRRSSVTVEQTKVKCWEQALSTTDVLKYEKLGISVNTKVYFTSDPGITDRHEIVITKRNGVAVSAANQKTLQQLQPAQPDAGAGLGVLYRVVGNDVPGANT